jgi:hypothetical protein
MVPQSLFLKKERPTISGEHFVRGHMLRVAADGSLIMIYIGYITEVALPCTRLGLYAIKRLTLSLEEGRPPRPVRREPARHSVSGAGPTTRREPAHHSVSGVGPTMRARTRWMEETVGPSHPKPPPPETSASCIPRSILQRMAHWVIWLKVRRRGISWRTFRPAIRS